MTKAVGILGGILMNAPVRLYAANENVTRTIKNAVLKGVLPKINVLLHNQT